MESLSPKSAWSAPRVEEFFRSYVAPLRVAVQTESGFPLLLSLWFQYEDGKLLCATKGDSRVAQCLRRDPRCAFELAPNEPPYFGVRGRGKAGLASEGAVELLGGLIDRYLGSRDSDLAGWLLRNAEDEVAISIDIEWMIAWDYSNRMGG